MVMRYKGWNEVPAELQEMRELKAAREARGLFSNPNHSEELLSGRQPVEPPLKEWYAEVKRNIECSDCGYNANPAALEFHHLNPSHKIKSVSQMVNDYYTIAAVQQEMDKCIVLCANCH